MAKTSWVIMNKPTCPGFINIPSVHMVGFRSKEEAAQECNRLNEGSSILTYFIEQAEVFQSTTTQEDNDD